MENTCNNAIVRLSFLFLWTRDEFLTEEAASTNSLRDVVHAIPVMW